MVIPDKEPQYTSIRGWISKYRTPLFAVSFWIIILLLSRRYMQVNSLTFADLADQLGILLRDSWYGPLIYIGVYLIRPLILFPASLLTILGGSIFGIWPGALYVLIAGTSSATIPYIFGRWFSSKQENKSDDMTRIQRFIRMLRDNPFQAVLTMRLLYLPYDAVSFVAGNLKIPFLTFFLATALGNLPGTLSFVGIGASIEGDITQGGVSLNPQTLVFSFVILIISIAVSQLLNRYQHRQLSASEAEGK